MSAAEHLIEADLIFARDAELEELRRRIHDRASFLLHGESGAGKSFLVQHVIEEYPRVLYCPDSLTGQSVFRALANSLVSIGDPVVKRVWGRSAMEAIKTRSVLAVRGLVLDALRERRYFVVLDHLARTSASLASDIRDIMFRGNTPVAAIARSRHMEDLGFLSSFFTLRSEQMRIAPFNTVVATQFADLVADHVGFRAANRDEVLLRIAERSGGLPGNIAILVKMALLPKYRSMNRVKFTPMYIDFRLAWHAANAY